jgi:hypothetical protein
VVRQIDAHGFGLQFSKVDDDFLDIFEELTFIDFLKTQAPLTVLYVHDETMARHLIDSGLVGKRVKQVKTTLDAICELQEPWSPVRSVVLDTTLSGLEFAAFLRAELPAVRRVLACPPKSSEAVQALASGLAHEIVNC